MTSRREPNPPTRHASSGSGEGDAAELAAPQAAALLPSELLQPGEVVVLLLKPSAWFIPLECLKTLSVTAIVASIVFILVDRIPPGTIELSRRDVVLTAILVGGIRLFWQFLEWLGRVYVLTDRRVIRVQGVVRIAVFEAPLKHITNTTLTFTLRERLFALGTIGFATAGAGPAANWRMLADPLRIHQTVVRTIERYR